MAGGWQFRCYVSAREVDEIRKSYDASSAKVKAKFKSRLKLLSNLPYEQWNEKLYKNLKGNCKGISEIRFFEDRVQQRPLGYKSDEWEFILLIWAREKNNRFEPPNACQQALNRKLETQSDRKRTNELWLKLQ